MEEGKKAAGFKAASWIESGMIVGLGTGTTASYFIEALAKRNLSIKTVASSLASAHLAKKLGMVVCELNAVSHIDITVDGADEIDAQKRMIKGGGGAHVREKILAFNSREMLVIVDETKLVPKIGRSKLPIEVISFGSAFTQKRIEALGINGAWRQQKGGLFVTENGNLIFDIQFSLPPDNPESLHEALLQIPGVIDTGFFFGFAKKVLVGMKDGDVRVID